MHASSRRTIPREIARKQCVPCSTVFMVLSLVTVLVGMRDPSLVGKTRFVLDGNRAYAELGFVRPDGSLHRALAFVDIGSQRMTVRESLFQELQLDQAATLSFRAGDMSVDVPAREVVTEPRAASSVGSDLKVEAMLPASILQRYQVVTDYRERTLTLAAPGLSHLGALPFHSRSIP